MRWFTLFLLLLNFPVATAQQEKLEELRRQISALQQEWEKTNASHQDAADALRDSELAISRSTRRLHEIKQQQRQAERALQQATQALQRLNTDLYAQQDALARLFRQLYLGGQQPALKLLLNQRDPQRTLRDLAYYRYIARERHLWLTRLQTALHHQASLTQEMRHRQQELASLRVAALEEHRLLEKERQSRKTTLQKISRQLKQQKREIHRLQRDEARLSQLVSQLTAMLAPAGRKAVPGDAPPASTPFAALKGRLALPVSGTLRNRFGELRPDTSLPWKGLFLQAPSATPVKAIAAGRVVFADWLRGFGNLLIIDHGNGYMSLYGNNETLYKQVGDTLLGGEIIALVGNSGGNEQSGLYFEVRHEGRPQDPLIWMAP